MQYNGNILAVFPHVTMKIASNVIKTFCSLVKNDIYMLIFRDTICQSTVLHSPLDIYIDGYFLDIQHRELRQKYPWVTVVL